MKTSRTVLDKLTSSVQFKPLGAHKCYAKFLSLLPQHLQKAIAFVYIKNETLFIALKHPGFKMELNYNKDLLKSEFEMNLHLMIEENIKSISEKINKELFDDIFKNISLFSKPLNDFFDNVMVMDRDEDIRSNRLGLLLSLKKCFDMVCDLSKLIY